MGINIYTQAKVKWGSKNGPGHERVKYTVKAWAYEPAPEG
jgi:hypothetical protein